MKKIAKNIVVTILGWQVRRLYKRHRFTTIGVVGSIGKTSTKFAVARVLSGTQRVRFQEGNYNDIVTVPLVLFSQDEPSLFNPLVWLRVFMKNERTIAAKHTPFDVAVVEIGTDAPGQIARFGKYLHCDIAVVTAITPEHMEYFGTLDAVAQEELSVQDYTDHLVINEDYCGPKHLPTGSAITRYGTNKAADFSIQNEQFGMSKATFDILRTQHAWLEKIQIDAVSRNELYSATAAAIIANRMGIDEKDILASIQQLQPVSGRMQRLKGINNSLIIDETYNSSPEAAKAALDSLYSLEARQKIALLGNMNEFGDLSADAHTEIGSYCQPDKVDLVVTLGPDANHYTAEAARQNGCNVATFDDPYSAGEYIKKHIKSGAIVLAKGSQNGVFAEEAVKILLANPDDTSKLVRQSEAWLRKKAKAFKDHA